VIDISVRKGHFISSEMLTILD